MKGSPTKIAECLSRSAQMHSKPNWDKGVLMGCTNTSVVNTLKDGATLCIRGISRDAKLKRTEGFEKVQSLHLDSVPREALGRDRMETECG